MLTDNDNGFVTFALAVGKIRNDREDQLYRRRVGQFFVFIEMVVYKSDLLIKLRAFAKLSSLADWKRFQ